MTVAGINGTDFYSRPMQGGMQQDDFFCRDIQNQIRRKQEELRQLSEDKDKSPEEKLKKRQEIEQEITGLNARLREHQMEQKKKEQNQGTSVEDMLGGRPRTKGKKGQNTGLSQTGMQAMIAADSSMKQAEVHQSVAQQMEGRAAVLRAEIKQDGGASKGKEEELAKMEQKASDATASQMNALSDTNRILKESAEAEKEEKDEKKAEKSHKKNANENEEKVKNSAEDEDGKTDTRNERQQEQGSVVDVRL